jgi:hypothetical protein
MNWRAKLLISLQVIINLIGATTTRTGLEVCAQLDKRSYPDRIRVSDVQLAAANIHTTDFHPDWNYLIKPQGS